MPSPPLSDKSRLLPILWNEFLQKVDGDWAAKYQYFGDHRRGVRKKLKFAATLLEDMSKNSKASAVATAKSLSPQTLYTYLKNNGFPARLKKEIALLFTHYLGYPDWPSFAKAHPPATLKEQQNPNENGRPPSRDGSGWMFWGP